MSRRTVWFCRVAAIAALVAMLAGSLPAAAQQPATSGPATLDPIQMALDEVESALKREGLSVRALYDLGQSLVPLRDKLDATIADLEPRQAQVANGLKQLGPAPATDAAPETASIAAERARLTESFNEIDATLKQARLLKLRAVQLGERIAERRRSLYAKQLFASTPSVLSPFGWIEAAQALHAELGVLGEVFRAWAAHIRAQASALRLAMAGLTLIALGFGLLMLLRWWRRRLDYTVGAPTRFAKALACFVAFVRIAVAAPLVVVVLTEVLDAFGLMTEKAVELTTGFAVAVVVASLGRAVATAVFAPDAAWRRLVAVDDAAALGFYRHYVWAARGLAALVFALFVHKMTAASPALTVATNMLYGLAVGGLLLHLLLSTRGSGEVAADSASRTLSIRGVGWLMLAVIVVALVTGYAGFAAFVAERLITTLAILGALYLMLVLVNAFFADVVTADTPRGRAIAANFGVSPRRMGLVVSLLSGGISLLLILCALVLAIGPWEVTASDFLDTLRNVAFGFRIGDFTISFSAIFAAAAVLAVVFLLTRVVQGWLSREILPRTDLEPSLRQSIATIVGYVGAIVAIVLALSQLGIDLQKVAIIAGALSVGIGFGLQSIVSNFVSGLILLAERPIRVGDWIVVGSDEGYVRRIRVRATEVETFERASVLIPNSQFITNSVKNWTHANTTGRITVKVGVGYDSDPEKVRDLLLRCAAEHPGVLKSPPPRALLLNFGDSALDFELRCFLAEVESGAFTRSDLHFAILRCFREAGIAIPFPQRDVNLKDGVPPSTGGQAEAGEKPAA